MLAKYSSSDIAQSCVIFTVLNIPVLPADVPGTILFLLYSQLFSSAVLSEGLAAPPVIV